MFGGNSGHQTGGFFLRKAYNWHYITFNLVLIINYKLDMACIFENGQGYKIGQTKALGLDTFSYGISTQGMDSLQ
jgi:hypothetical protein